MLGRRRRKRLKKLPGQLPGLLIATIRKGLENQVPDMAASFAYYAFLAIPAGLLLLVGLFASFASPESIGQLIEAFGQVMPEDVTNLIGNALLRQSTDQGGSLALTMVGFVLALWTATGAMTAAIRALNKACGVRENRSFIQQRLVALGLICACFIPFALVLVLLILGPPLSGKLGAVLHAEGVVTWGWWLLQWPILFGALLLAFSIVLNFGPARRARLQPFTIGGVTTTLVWLALSSLFSLYTSHFGNYNQIWGSFAVVIVMLTWLWLSGLVFLFGAELDAEIARRRGRRL